MDTPQHPGVGGIRRIHGEIRLGRYRLRGISVDDPRDGAELASEDLAASLRATVNRLAGLWDWTGPELDAVQAAIDQALAGRGEATDGR